MFFLLRGSSCPRRRDSSAGADFPKLKTEKGKGERKKKEGEIPSPPPHPQLLFGKEKKAKEGKRREGQEEPAARLYRGGSWMPERAPRLVSFAAALVNCAAPLVNFAARRPGSGGWALGAEGARAAAAGGEAGRAAWGSAAGSSLRAPPLLLLLLPPARFAGSPEPRCPRRRDG